MIEQILFENGEHTRFFALGGLIFLPTGMYLGWSLAIDCLKDNAHVFGYKKLEKLEPVEIGGE